MIVAITTARANATHSQVVHVGRSFGGRRIAEGANFRAASAMAWDLAEAAPTAELHIVHVVENRLADGPEGPALDGEEKRLNSLALAKARRASADSPPIRRMVTHVWRGSPAEETAKLAAELGAGLVVVGTHGRHGAARLLLGSVADDWCESRRARRWWSRRRNDGKWPKLCVSSLRVRNAWKRDESAKVANTGASGTKGARDAATLPTGQTATRRPAQAAC